MLCGVFCVVCEVCVVVVVVVVVVCDVCDAWCGVCCSVVCACVCVVCVVVVVRTGASCECLSSHMRACIKLKWVSANALTPSAGLTSRSKTLRPFPPKAGSGRSQVQKPHPTPIRGKRLRDTPASPPHSFGGRGAQSFPSPWS